MGVVESTNFKPAGYEYLQADIPKINLATQNLSE